MKSILEDIKNEKYQKIYLFYGEEDYLKKQYKERLAKALGSEDTMNFTTFRGSQADPDEMISLGETMPFLAEQRTILVENSGFFSGKTEKLPEYLKEMPEYLHIIFVEKDVDKRSRMFKAVKSEGKIVEFARQNEDTLIRWVLGILKNEGKRITRQDMEWFLACTGTDMNMISNELAKLLSYVGEAEIIRRADIEAICSVQLQDRIFDMIRAMMTGDRRKALKLYQDMLDLKVKPGKILRIARGEFNKLMRVKELMELGENQDSIARKTGMHRFVVRNYMGYSRHIERSRLVSAVSDFIQVEEDANSGRLNDQVGLEMLIIKYSE